MNTEDEAKGKVLPFRARSGGGGGAAADLVVVPYYPHKLKAYYKDLLLLYKKQRASEQGKAVGWQAIRDEIMAEEDALLGGTRQQQKIKVDVDRPRSAALDLEDLKSWYRAGNSHMLSDPKFQYIDRFIRGLRIEGRIEAIERAVSEARREYFRESMVQFYRPDVAFPKVVDRESDDLKVLLQQFMNQAAFVGICQKGYDDDGKKIPDYGVHVRFVVILLCGEFKRCAAPVELIACFASEKAWSEARKVSSGPLRSIAPDLVSRCSLESDRIIPLFSGFFIPESGRGNIGFEFVSGSLFTVRPVDAMLYNQGVPHQTPRYYEPKVDVIAAHGGAMFMAETPVDALITLGLDPIVDESPDQSKNRSGLVKCKDNAFLSEIRTKFEIGYRPC